jgi:cytidylate kinase
MLITISGPPGSGKSTVAAAVAETFDLEHVSGGDVFRGLAEERGLSLAEFNERAEGDDSIDRDLDRRLRDTAQDRDDVVLESRLSGWMAGEHADLRVWLDAPLDVRAARIADREGSAVEDAREETRAREESERLRYQEYYGIDFADRSIYDLAVNTARWDAEAVAAIVEDAIRRYDHTVDEGAVPVVADYGF